MQMDAASLLAACKQHRLFQTPGLNDKLYANFQGFTAIAGLEPYTGLRALFLEGNALESTAGLPPLPELRCLRAVAGSGWRWPSGWRRWAGTARVTVPALGLRPSR